MDGSNVLQEQFTISQLCRHIKSERKLCALTYVIMIGIVGALVAVPGLGLKILIDQTKSA